MAIPNSSWDDILTSTLYARAATAADNVTKHSALLTRLKEKNRIKYFTGGVSILEHLEYAANTTVMNYSGYEPLNITPSPHLSSAQFEVKQKAVSCSISGLEMLQNTSKEQIIDLLESRVGNAEKSLVNALASDVYLDGTQDGGRGMGGLQLLIVTNPLLGTVGGISRADNAFWRNQTYSGLTDGSAAVASTTIQKYMNRLWMKCVRGTDKPDLIVADQLYYGLFWESLQAMQRIVDESKLVDAGFQATKFQSADVVFEGTGISIPSNTMYFINSDYLKYRPAKSRDIVPLNPDRFATDSDALVKLLGWAGNMTICNASLQGILSA